MKILSIYDKCFIDVLNIPASQLDENLSYQSVKSWDSAGHMSLITHLERCFDIIFDTVDIIEFSSYEKGKEILKKYEFDF